MHSTLFPDGKAFFGELPALDVIKKSQNFIFCYSSPISLRKVGRARKVARTGDVGNLDFRWVFLHVLGKYPRFRDFTTLIMVDVSG